MWLIEGALLVNEGQVIPKDVLVEGERIARVSDPGTIEPPPGVRRLDAKGLHLFPGVIDDQVHFREPGLTHKGDLASESRAAVAGGITSYMEMPNTVPAATTLELLEQKYARAAEVSAANYSFFMGTSPDNLGELLRLDPRHVCGVKIFMGSSTGNLLVDDPQVLEDVFREVRLLIAVHCEKDALIAAEAARYRALYGEDVPMSAHPQIRNAEACYASSSFAVELAEKHGTRLHILHISTARETELFRNDIPLTRKRITSEACIHHLWFTDADYAALGARIKWNPAIKSVEDREAIRAAVRDGRIDVIATDHAPHTREEKSSPYFKCPAGGPLVQHGLPAMLEMVREGVFDLPMVPLKMSHHVADLFGIADRGYIREGYFADLVLVNLNSPWLVKPDNLLYKCGWSPFEGVTFRARIEKTFVNGSLAYSDGAVDPAVRGKRLVFSR